MSTQYRFETKEDVIGILETVDFPQCLIVNYDPSDKGYYLNIGNQPYYTCEQLIELEQKEKENLRKKLGEIRMIVGDVMADYIRDGEIKSKDLVKIYGLSEGDRA